jgi:hypothetical protein
MARPCYLRIHIALNVHVALTMAASVPRSHPDNTISNVGIKTFDSGIIAALRTAPDNETHAWLIHDNAVHVANPPKQTITAIQPFMTAKIRGGKIHGNKIQNDKATASCSFRLDYAVIQNRAAFIANRKALAAIWH